MFHLFDKTKKIIYGYSDNEIQIKYHDNFSNNKEDYRIIKIPPNINKIVFTQKNNYIIFVTNDKIILWDLVLKKEMYNIPLEGILVNVISIANKIFCVYNQSIVVYDFIGYKNKVFRYDEEIVLSCHNDAQVVFYMNDNSFLFYDVLAKDFNRTEKIHIAINNNNVLVMAVDNNSNLVAIGTNNYIYLFYKDGSLINSIYRGKKAINNMQLCFNGDGTYLACVTDSLTVHVYILEYYQNQNMLTTIYNFFVTHEYKYYLDALNDDYFLYFPENGILNIIDNDSVCRIWIREKIMECSKIGKN